jgi:hypothetical protein
MASTNERAITRGSVRGGRVESCTAATDVTPLLVCND